jgi:hypothetical protein
MKVLFEIKYILLKKWFLMFFAIAFQLANSVVFAQEIDIEKEIWQLENRFWNDLDRNDTTSCKKLWIHKQIKYKSEVGHLNDQHKSSHWINELHADNDLEFSFALYLKAIEITENVVKVYYDVNKFWTDKQHTLRKSKTFSFSHTWKKSDNSWLLSNGIAIEN